MQLSAEDNQHVGKKEISFIRAVGAAPEGPVFPRSIAEKSYLLVIKIRRLFSGIS